MTPRDAEVAFLLERVPGVVAVYAIRDRPPMRWAVRHDGTRALAAAHSALERVLPHDECLAVHYFMADPGRYFEDHLELLVLDSAARDATLARIASLPPRPIHCAAVLPGWSGSGFSVLIVDPGQDIARAAVQAYGPESTRVHLKDNDQAIRMVLARHFDLIVCTARSAYGPGGLLPTLRERRSSQVDTIVILVPAGDEHYASAERATLDAPNFHAHAPLDPDLFRFLRTPTTPPAARFQIPVLGPRKPSPPRRAHLRVLVIDERETGARTKTLTQIVARKAWEAFDRLESERWDLVICSLTMRFGSQKLYRALWEAHPDQKPRFAFLVDSPDPSQPRLIGRPLTTASVQALLDRIDFIP